MKIVPFLGCLLALSSISSISASTVHDADDEIPEEILFSFIQISDYALNKIENLRGKITQTLKDYLGIYRVTVGVLTKVPEVMEMREMLESTTDISCLEMFNSNLEFVIRKSSQIVRHELHTQFKELEIEISRMHSNLINTKTILVEHLRDRTKKPEVCTEDGKCESLLQFMTRVNTLFNEVVNTEKTETVGILASNFLWLRGEETSQLIRGKIVRPVTKCLQGSNQEG